MNNGELKAIVENFVQVKKAIAEHLIQGGMKTVGNGANK